MRTLALVPALAACAPAVEEPDCTALAAISVVATVTAGGAPPPEQTVVTFESQGQGEAPCEPFGQDGQWACGFEVDGPITVRADAPGWGAAETTVRIDADACHVITQDVTLDLPPLDCPDVVRYAVEVTVEDAAGEPVLGAEVGAMPLGENWTGPEPCPVLRDNVHACLEDWAGEIEIWASKAGVGSAYDVVPVEADECGPITEAHTSVLTR